MTTTIKDDLKHYIDVQNQDSDLCLNCVFMYVGAPPDESANYASWCRRYPPTPILTNIGAISVVPKVDDTWWCGEHQRRKTESD